jgi:hypothetical protein
MAKKKKSAPTNQKTPQQTRLWLMYPPKLIKEPLIWKLGRKFPVVTNIRQCSVTDEIGVVCLELDGKRADVKPPSNGCRKPASASSRWKSMWWKVEAAVQRPDLKCKRRDEFIAPFFVPHKIICAGV